MARRPVPLSNMARLEALVAELPEAIRVDVAEWGDHPTFRVRNKNFVFSNDDATSLSFKLTPDEAAAVTATHTRPGTGSAGTAGSPSTSHPTPDRIVGTRSPSGSTPATPSSHPRPWPVRSSTGPRRSNTDRGLGLNRRAGSAPPPAARRRHHRSRARGQARWIANAGLDLERRPRPIRAPRSSASRAARRRIPGGSLRPTAQRSRTHGVGAVASWPARRTIGRSGGSVSIRSRRSCLTSLATA
jgi:hypothetical protein